MQPTCPAHLFVSATHCCTNAQHRALHFAARHAWRGAVGSGCFQLCAWYIIYPHAAWQQRLRRQQQQQHIHAPMAACCYTHVQHALGLAAVSTLVWRHLQPRMCMPQLWGVPEVVSTVHGTKQDDLDPPAHVRNGDCQQHSQQVTVCWHKPVRLVTHRAFMCSTCPRVA